jgi:hypothetical protein
MTASRRHRRVSTDRAMNRNQAIALAFAAGNILLILLFPPFDAYSMANTKVPIFAGFEFYPRHTPNMVINFSLLYLEIMVVLINAGIALLLLRERKMVVSRRRISMQNATLIFVAINLVVIVLFPPFESVYAMTNAALPTFEGFYFIFARQENHVVVATILYLEVFLVLINGVLFWLIFRERKQEALSPEEAMKVMLEMRKRGQ